MHCRGGAYFISFLLLAAIWCAGHIPALAQTRLLDEFKLGVFAHSVDRNGSEEGVDLNMELLLRRPAIAYGNVFADVLLRPRLHIGGAINTSGNTNQLYAGFTWDCPLGRSWLMDISFGGALHDGPTGDNPGDSYGCALNFRESLSIGYALDERWRIYG